MSRKKIGWKFPSSGYGSNDGFNDSGMAHFSGAKFASVAREIIQNSLDASANHPVKVEFDLVKISSKDFPGQTDLLEIFKQCLNESKDNKDEKAKSFFEEGVKILKKSEILLLKIADYNTTGLSCHNGNDLWEKLTKGRGSSGKDSAIAGGSFGIGKSAPYVISKLRTVFYSSMFEEDKEFVHKMQGRSILMSHGVGDRRTQGTGFYGGKTYCDPIVGHEIPSFLKREEQGTTVCVAGLQGIKDWENHIAAAVVSSFFVAIKEKKLCVSIGDSIDINAGTLESVFDKLLKYSKEDYFQDVEIAKQMYTAIQSGEGEERDIQLRQGIGLCTLHILVGDRLPQKVGIIRNTGMMITSEQKQLQRFPGLGDFIAVCICNSTEGNVMLRKMENPQHNAFEPDRLEDSKKEGVAALKELATKIRKVIKEVVAPEIDKSMLINEMGDFFPDVDDNTDPNDTDTPDRDFEGRVVITRVPPKPPKLPPKPPPEKPPEKLPKPPKPPELADIQKLRIVNGQSAKERIVHFTPNESGEVALEFWIIGDQEYEKLRLTIKSQEEMKKIPIVKGKRVTLSIEMVDNVHGSIRIVAIKPNKENKDEV